MKSFELDSTIEHFVAEAVALKTRYDQLKYVIGKMNDSTYQTEYETFLKYYFFDGYNQLVLSLYKIYDNDRNNLYNFFNYINMFLKNMDTGESHDGFFGVEKYDEVKKAIIAKKKKLNSYRDLITDFRSKNIAHLDKNYYEELIELEYFNEPIDLFLELAHDLVYYKNRITMFHTYSYMNEIEELMEKLRYKPNMEGDL